MRGLTAERNARFYGKGKTRGPATDFYGSSATSKGRCLGFGRENIAAARSVILGKPVFSASGRTPNGKKERRSLVAGALSNRATAEKHYQAVCPSPPAAKAL